MSNHLSSLRVRASDLNPSDAATVGALIDAYLRQTEREKAEHALRAAFTESMALPAAYQDEVNAPASTFRDAAVYLAEIDSTPVGIAVVKHVDDATEIKRLWAQPEARGRGVGSALLDTITSHHGGPIRLTVWDWRADAIRMYRSRGFALVTPWDERPRLVCMERMP